MAGIVSQLYMEIAEVVIAAGAAPLSKHPGCYAHAVAGTPWSFAINGHDVPSDHPLIRGSMVPPFTVSIIFNGWPAGVIDPTGGILLAGEEDALISALRVEAARLRGAS